MSHQILVVGLGSIGQRHARIAAELGWQVSTVSHYPGRFPNYPSIGEAARQLSPDLVIIAKPTSEHYACMVEVEGCLRNARVLVEKPLFESHKIFIPTQNTYYVAYNLRFHPIFQAVQDAIGGDRVIFAHLTAGSFLPDWRPGRPYQESYSSRRALGGGVLRDLSHELDLLCSWMGTRWDTRSVSINTGQLDIDSDDLCMALLRNDVGTNVFLHLDYLSQIPFRRGLIRCADKTIAYDFGLGTLEVSGSSPRSFETTRDQSYRAQLLCLASSKTGLCSLQGGLDVMALIHQLSASHAGTPIMEENLSAET